MPFNLKEMPKKPKRFVSGGRTCAGCAIPVLARTILGATDKPIVACTATGCMEVTSSIYPFSSWNIPWIHSAFENAAATISGVEAAYKALKRKGKVTKDIKFIAFGGDGGTYDIGIQALSGAMERGHDMLYVCYDNNAYMNTGNQGSSATPYGAATTTTPAGKVKQGKEQWRKDLVKIIAAHNIPYAAQAAVHNLADLYKKAEKALSIEGPAFITVLAPCTTLWKYPPEMTMQYSKLAVETKFWPLFEIENGKLKVNYKPSKEVPVEEFLKGQGRFRHLFKPENKGMLEHIQKTINENWERLLREEGL
ncbi:MAG: pyruvate ferredoxin oxidoreductase [Candidatus Aenigmarchaeota archaeon]|nr:pyruvate ferredoxin oxidoreductase [Candidatus Aenigmarchaeota archaeon]